MTTRDPRKWMWAEAMALLDEADHLQRQFFRLGTQEAATPRWEPPVDVFESGNQLWLFYALPGVRAERVQVTLEGNVLAVRGERRLPAEARSAAIRRLEIPYGHFERRVALPSGRYELLQRELDSGCLVIGLRRVG